LIRFEKISEENFFLTKEIFSLKKEREFENFYSSFFEGLIKNLVKISIERGKFIHLDPRKKHSLAKKAL